MPKISDIRVYPIPKNKQNGRGFPVVAMVHATFGDVLVLKGMRLVKGDRGYFVSMPSKPEKNADGESEYKDVAFFPDRSTKDKFDKVVLSKYKAAIDKSRDNDDDDDDDDDYDDEKPRRSSGGSSRKQPKKKERDPWDADEDDDSDDDDDDDQDTGDDIDLW